MRPLPTIDRNLLVAVSGGLTSSVRARPAQKEPVPLVPPRPPAAAGAALGAQAPGVGAQAQGPAAADPMASMVAQLAQQR